MSRSWTTAAASVRGARHALRGEPSEDTFGTSETAEVSVIAVADGHSSSQCPRARIGAQLAVEAALEVLGNQNPADDTGRAIVERWRLLVDQHLATDPPTEDEVARGPSYMLYGTTLAAAATTRDRIRVFQIGDSDVLLTGNNGTIPSPHMDRNGPLSETYSLALGDAPESAAYAEYPHERFRVDIVVLMTDGFSSAFADSNWQEQTLEDLRRRLNSMGADELEKSIARWCEGPAKVAGDDTTLGLLVDSSVFARTAVAS